MAYFEWVQPRIGEGKLEDSRPPRGANMVGLAVLSAASIAYAIDATILGAALGLLVAALATGFLLVVLSCALFNNWLPHSQAVLQVIAPLWQPPSQA